MLEFIFILAFATFGSFGAVIFFGVMIKISD